MRHKWLSVDIQERHITYDTKRIIKNTTDMFIALNPKLKKKAVAVFVKDIFHAPQFECDWNNYHNIHHTYEVVEMVAYTVFTTRLNHDLSPFEKTVLLVAAICHDFGHNGKTNNDWDDVAINMQKMKIPSICSNMSLSNMSQSDSVDREHSNHRIPTEEAFARDLSESFAQSKSYNEIMHLDMSVCIVFKHKHTILENRSNAEIARMLSSLILATDLKTHNPIIQRFKAENIKNIVNLDIMMIVLKLADISHIMRPFRVHAHWVYNLIQEANHSSHARISFEEWVPSVSYMANDTINFAEKFVGELLDVMKSICPGFSPALRANYKTNLDIWKSYL